MSDFVEYSNLNTNINDDLQNELLELAELYPDTEEEDILENEGDVEEGLFEKDYENIEQGYQPNIPLQDPLLNLLKSERDDSLFYNTDEENEVIIQCVDKDLQALLIKNRVRAKQLRVLRIKLFKVLQECVGEVHCKKPSKTSSCLTMPKSDYWKLGIPYFKDDQFFKPSENSDEIKKRNNKECFMFDFRVGRRWSSKDQITLENRIGASYYKHRLNEQRLQTSTVYNYIKTGAMRNTELLKLEEDLEDIKANPAKYSIPPINSEVGVDWSEVADSFKGIRTVNECKALWNVYLHPQINKTQWTDDENKKIVMLVKKYNGQNWDLIALDLNTNRTGYLVFLNYFSNLLDKFKNARFRQGEDETLLKVIDRCRIGSFIPWRTVALHFKDRSKTQLYHRYKYYLAPANVVKGSFTEAEDILIVYLIKKFGRNYAQCATYIPTRTNIQIRNRYTMYLQELVTNVGEYSDVEDQKILDHVKAHGTKKWGLLADEFNRRRSHVRQRYYTLIKLMKKPGVDINKIPTRKLTVLSKQNKQRRGKMIEILEQLDNYSGEVTLDTVSQILGQKGHSDLRRRPWRVEIKNSSPSYLDFQLIAFFKGTCKIQREYKGFDEKSIKDSAVRVTKLLDLLGSSLDFVSAIQENDPNFTVREREVVVLLKNSSNPNPSMLTLAPQVRSILPPTLSTLLGLRGLIVKYQVHKNESIAATTENNDAQRLFFHRLYALFKWPSILSKSFPETIEESTESTITEQQPETEVLKRARGRPPKTENYKVALMLNSRKRKRFEFDDLNTTDEPVKVPNLSILKNEKKKEDEVRIKYFKPRAKSRVGVAKPPPVAPDVVSTISASTLEMLRSRINNKIVVWKHPHVSILNVVKFPSTNSMTNGNPSGSNDKTYL